MGSKVLPEPALGNTAAPTSPVSGLAHDEGEASPVAGAFEYRLVSLSFRVPQPFYYIPSGLNAVVVEQEWEIVDTPKGMHIPCYNFFSLDHLLLS